MNEIVLNSWEEFEDHLLHFFKELTVIRQRTSSYISTPLFRGQGDASWKLETTLDRSARYTVSMEEYFRRIRAVRPAVVSLTDKEWILPEVHNDYDYGRIAAPPGYEFMIYLRHHGFPSPLLDWSRSPYVAAYFAFRFGQKAAGGTVAIYSYVEYLGEGKSWSGARPHITNLGPYVVSHRRHYSQQCEYTICKKGPETPDDVYVYAKHEDVADRKEPTQDSFKKYILPQSQREKVMDKLGLMNITGFSLFGSEESLMETLAYTEIEKRILGRAPSDPESAT